MAKKVYLSPSAQENNIGADNYGSEEYRMNQVADIVEPQLKRHGVIVKRNSPSMSLSSIVKDSNNFDQDLHQAIHSNAYDKTSRGCEVFCWKKGKGLLGEVLANNIYLEVAQITPTSDRGVKEAYNFYGAGKHMYEIANTIKPACLVEVDFHDNKQSAKWIIENIEPLGIAITKGILKTLKIEWIPEPIIIDGYVYRVVSGSYKIKDNALKQQKLLKQMNIDSFIEAHKIN